MARIFTTPIQLPGDPSSALQAATKNYVDGKVASVGQGTGVTITGTATSPVVNTAYGTTSGTAAQGNDARLPDAKLRASAPYAPATSTIDPTAGNNPTYAASVSHTLTMLEAGALYGQEVTVAVGNSSPTSAITVTLATSPGGLYVTTGLSGSVSIASMKVGYFRFRFESLIGGHWVFMAYTAIIT